MPTPSTVAPKAFRIAIKPCKRAAQSILSSPKDGKIRHSEKPKKKRYNDLASSKFYGRCKVVFLSLYCFWLTLSTPAFLHLPKVLTIRFPRSLLQPGTVHRTDGTSFPAFPTLQAGKHFQSAHTSQHKSPGKQTRRH